MSVVIHKISVGAGGKHTLSPQESLRRSVSLGNYAHNRSRANIYTRAIYGGEDNKQRIHNNGSFSSVTAATESLVLSDNSFKMA